MDIESTTTVTILGLSVVGFVMSLYSLYLQSTEVSQQNKRMIELLENILVEMINK